MSLDYTPARGDIIRIDIISEELNPDKNSRKYALVISPKSYNEKTELAIICPIKGKAKGYPFEVVIPDGEQISGIILSDQVKSINWKNRNAEYTCKLSDGKLSEVISKLLTLL